MAREMDVVPYDTNWTELYEKEKAILIGILGSKILEIHHFGSTSIEGMSAKPTIDVMVVVKDIDEVDAFNDEMAANGYMV